MGKKLVIRNTIKKVVYETWYCDVTGLTPDRIDYLMQEAYPADGVDGWKLDDWHDDGGEINPELILIDEKEQDNAE